jgi:1-acyl-sn-glycerol-3-phosphate acyltransferase
MSQTAQKSSLIVGTQKTEIRTDDSKGVVVFLVKNAAKSLRKFWVDLKGLIFIVSPFLFQVIIWPPTRFTLWLFGNLKVEGLKNLDSLPKGKGVIFAANHSSQLDPFLPPASLPFMSRFIPLFYATKEKSFYEKNGILAIFYGGSFFKLIGGQPVNSGLRDYSKSLANHVKLLEEGRNLFVFPEGGITLDGELKVGHGGIAYLAEKTDSTIIPIGISGVYKIGLKALFARKRNIKVTFGIPVSQQEIKQNISREADPIELYKRESEYIMGKISELIVKA